MIVPTAIDSAHLAFYAQSFDMRLLLLVVYESQLLVKNKKSDMFIRMKITDLARRYSKEKIII